jgi:hypothetical protein
MSNSKTNSGVKKQGGHKFYNSKQLEVVLAPTIAGSLTGRKGALPIQVAMKLCAFSLSEQF